MVTRNVTYLLVLHKQNQTNKKNSILLNKMEPLIYNPLCKLRQNSIIDI